MLTYSPYSFISPEQLQPRIKRAGHAEDDVEQRLVDAVNGATLWMERFTRRRLRARNYRTPVTIACSASSGSTTLSGTGFSTLVEDGDDAVGIGLEVGSQVVDVGGLTLNRATTAALSGTAVTFGSAPIRISGGDGGAGRFGGGSVSEIYLPEYPLVTLYSVYYDIAGTLTAIDTSGASYDDELGRIVLANDRFPSGRLNIVVNARVGYDEPIATSLGHWSWAALESAAMRVAEVLYLDALQVRGRSDHFSAGPVSTSFSQLDMPKDVLAMLAPFVRRWG